MKNQSGIGMIETIVGLALITIFVAVSISYLSKVNLKNNVNRTIATRDRILSGIRSLAGMPASIRNSMRASNSAGTAVNPELLACVGGNPPNSCQSGIEYPFALYSPVVVLDSVGNPIGIRQVSSPKGSLTPLRFDTFGTPCAELSDQCPIIVYTSFKAQCGILPPPGGIPYSAPIPNTALNRLTTCTFAELIEVNFSVQLDPALANSNSSLIGFLTPFVGTVVTAVVDISGNQPQQ